MFTASLSGLALATNPPSLTAGWWPFSSSSTVDYGVCMRWCVALARARARSGAFGVAGRARTFLSWRKRTRGRPSAPPSLTLPHPPTLPAAVYKDIAALLDSNEDYDDGSYGPLLVRLAWHAAGTWDPVTKTGGSNGSTMRFKAESSWGANAGLGTARSLLEKVKAKHPGITYADLWSLAGACAITQMGGPVIPWRPGRADLAESTTPPDGRLPDATKGASHLRGDIFYRMGFNDQEIVRVGKGAGEKGGPIATRDNPPTPLPPPPPGCPVGRARAGPVPRGPVRVCRPVDARPDHLFQRLLPAVGGGEVVPQDRPQRRHPVCERGVRRGPDDAQVGHDAGGGRQV